MLLLAIAITFGGALACFGWYRWDSSRNRGYTFGYYGELNRVGNALAQIPGVKILGSAHNPDITLEEFTFYIRTDDGARVQLWFGERDPARRLSGKRLMAELRRRIGNEVQQTISPVIQRPC